MSSRDPGSWMWAQAVALLEEAEGLHRRFFRLALGEATPVWELPVDILEDEGGLTIMAALPGVSPEAIRIEIGSGIMSIVAERPMPIGPGVTAIHRLEIPYGRFERRVELPPGRYRLEHEQVANGCLLLRLGRLSEF